MKPEELFLETARSLNLDACGSCSIHFSPLLKEKLEKAGPIPFAPPDLEERIHPEKLLPSAKSLFVILFPYRVEEGEGNIALYARSKDYHRINHQYMNRIIKKMKETYPEEGFLALTDTSPMVDRWLAYAAGLGFFGKNHCFINPVYGSYVTIGSILTTLELPESSPSTLSCGDCDLCQKACPGGVIRPHHFNPYLCKSYLTQKKEELSPMERRIIRRTPLIFGCDECQTRCPFNKDARYSPLHEMKENRISSLDKEQMESLSNRAFDKTYRDYAFTWRGRKILLRNWEIIHEEKPEKE